MVTTTKIPADTTTTKESLITSHIPITLTSVESTGGHTKSTTKEKSTIQPVAAITNTLESTVATIKTKDSRTATPVATVESTIRSVTVSTTKTEGTAMTTSEFSTSETQHSSKNHVEHQRDYCIIRKTSDGYRMEC